MQFAFFAVYASCLGCLITYRVFAFGCNPTTWSVARPSSCLGSDVLGCMWACRTSEAPSVTLSFPGGTPEKNNHSHSHTTW